MSPAEFKPAIPASERPQIHALDRAATAVGIYRHNQCLFCLLVYSLFSDAASASEHITLKYLTIVSNELERLCLKGIVE